LANEGASKSNSQLWFQSACSLYEPIYFKKEDEQQGKEQQAAAEEASHREQRASMSK